MKRKNSLIKNILYNNFYELLLVLMPLITAPYVHRVLGAEGIGIYSYTNSIVSYFVLVSGLGTLAYGKRAIAMRRDDKASYSKAFWEIEFITVVVSIVCLLVWGYAFWTNGGYGLYFKALTLLILSSLLNISWLYAGLEEFKYTVFVNSVCKILSVVAIFAFVKTEHDLLIYLYIYAGAQLLGNLSLWVFLPRFVVVTAIDLKSVLAHIKETFIYFIPAIASTLYSVLDKTLIGVIMEDRYNGYYESATKILKIAEAATFAGINGVVSSRASYLYAHNEQEKIKEYIKNVFNIEQFIGIGCTFGIAGVASTFVPLFFGKGYEPTTDILYILGFIIPIMATSNMVGTLYYIPVGKRGQSAIYLLIGTGINLVMNLILIPLFGTYGAAAASLFAEIVITVLYIVNCNGYLKWQTIYMGAGKKLIAGIIMFLVVYALNYWNVNMYIRLIVQMGIGVGVYTGILWIVKDYCIEMGLKFVKRKE